MSDSNTHLTTTSFHGVVSLPTAILLLTNDASC
jgi:hypothetical protein